jgi:hypothetical protein
MRWHGGLVRIRGLVWSVALRSIALSVLLWCGAILATVTDLEAQEEEVAKDIAKAVVSGITYVGKKVYALIKDGKPVSGAELESSHALPAGILDPMALSDWRMGRSEVIDQRWLNGNGRESVRISFHFVFSYWGQYNGHGRYLAAVTVVPDLMSAAVFRKVNLSAHIASVLNIGSQSEPVAAIGVVIESSINSVASSINTSHHYILTGRGELCELTDVGMTKLHVRGGGAMNHPTGEPCT